MRSDRLGEADRVCACKLIESVLLNCRGHVDKYVPAFLNLAFTYIFTGSMKTTEFKVHCIEIVINCIYYNPRLTLQLLEENQWTQGFFTLWFNTLDKFSRSVSVAGMRPLIDLLLIFVCCSLMTVEFMTRSSSLSPCALFWNFLLILFLPLFWLDGLKC